MQGIIENAVAAVEQVENAVVANEAHEEIKGILDGLGAIKKVKSLTPAARDIAGAPLRDSLAEAIARIGKPVARGNSLYLSIDGGLVVIDLTPGVLVRL